MPHSSGGGSGGGGFHGGSRSSPSARISVRPFSGGQRYRYHYRGETKYYYSDQQPRKLFSWKRMLLLPLLLPFFIIIPWMTYDTAVQPYFGDFPPHVLIRDEAHVMKEPEGLRLTLEDFYEKSGIPTAVITVYNETWQGRYASLEQYAYDRYLEEFDDEMHWLIVYSEPKEHPAQFEEWCWEGMQGDYTDPVLTEKVTAQFGKDLENRLEAGVGSVEFNINQAFLGVMHSVKRMTLFTPVKGILMALVCLALLLFYAYFILGLNNFRYRNAVPDDGSE